VGGSRERRWRERCRGTRECATPQNAIPGGLSTASTVQNETGAYVVRTKSDSSTSHCDF